MKSIDEHPNDLLTVPETAELLRLKPSTIRAWVCQRRIPYVKLGRLVRIKRSDAEALIQASVVPMAQPEFAGVGREQR